MNLVVVVVFFFPHMILTTCYNKVYTTLTITMSHIYTQHLPYKLAKPPSTTNFAIVIWNLYTFIKKEHKKSKIGEAKLYNLAKSNISNDQIHLSNSLWKTHNKPLSLKLPHPPIQINAIHGKPQGDLVLAPTFSNYTLCHGNDKDMWCHLLSLCNHKLLKGLIIARHNAATQHITNLLNSNLHTQHYTLTNASNKEEHPQDHTVPSWLLPLSCHTTRCTCLGGLCIHIIYTQGATQDQNGPFLHASTQPYK